MLICATFKIPVSVYVDTEDESVYRVVVDDEAPLRAGQVDFVETGGREVWADKLTGATKRRLMRAHEAIRDAGSCWPAWEFGY